MHSDLVTLVGAVVALAFFVLIGVVVIRLDHVPPARLAAILATLATLCGVLPAILGALHG